jgi:hypothetical protein
MKPKKMIQNTSLPDTKIQECCQQVEDQHLEAAPESELLKLSADRENETSPYYHREIF